MENWSKHGRLQLWGRMLSGNTDALRPHKLPTMFRVNVREEQYL